MQLRNGLVLAAFVLCASCGKANPPTAPMTADPTTDGGTVSPDSKPAMAAAGDLNLDVSANGTTVDVHPGQSIVVTLSTNPTTGFDWTVTSAPPGLGEPQTATAPPEGGGEGKGTKKKFTWKPTGAVAGDLELAYKRGFEKDTAPLKTFKVTLRDAK